ncbi:Uma2 family endonuclease [Synechococcales cyanobacterium C]|uniref:Uma2 family endonuclease n=1 Tax=Petrachloros mirabilis ULC683 TaxID=2781853 RepID=A0A8K2A0G7_9CYAN|nr:Uma2 family endonuclease [Petrachloros mirabilis]NCJ08549.1 Uma2 family endonuclease [Petrachloros mirabilis ULC683]
MATILNLEPLTTPLTRAQFRELCQGNPELNLERSPQGELIIMSPVGGESGKQEATLITKVGIWNEQTQLGYVFSSSTIFSLPQGGDRSPDVAWVAKARWEALSPEEREAFPPLCPDFVMELRSPSDRLSPLQTKMQEYLDSGLKLGWLINPQQQQVEIYRPDCPPKVISLPATLSGEDVLPEFQLSL